MSTANYSFPEHLPAFVDEVVASASQEVLDACNDNIRCIFDASQTGNLEIGVNSMQTEETNMENEMIASKQYTKMECIILNTPFPPPLPLSLFLPLSLPLFLSSSLFPSLSLFSPFLSLSLPSPSANNPPNITGPATFMVRLNEESSLTITVTDTNLNSFTSTSGVAAGGSIVPDDTDPSLYTFTWTPATIIQNPIVFLATDDLGASSQYEPIIEFCQCLNGSMCTLEGVLNQLANPVDLECICATGEQDRGDR